MKTIVLNGLEAVLAEGPYLREATGLVVINLDNAESGDSKIFSFAFDDATDRIADLVISDLTDLILDGKMPGTSIRVERYQGQQVRGFVLALLYGCMRIMLNDGTPEEINTQAAAMGAAIKNIDHNTMAGKLLDAVAMKQIAALAERISDLDEDELLERAADAAAQFQGAQTTQTPEPEVAKTEVPAVGELKSSVDMSLVPQGLRDLIDTARAKGMNVELVKID